VISFVRTLSSSNFQSSVTIRKPALLPSSGNGKLPVKWTPVVLLFSVTGHHSNYIFNIPTKCTYAIKYMYYYQNCPACFGAYCAILRENFIVRSKLLLRWLIIDIKLYCIWAYNSLYNYVKPYLVQHKTEDVKSSCIRLFLYLFVDKCYCYFL
jgi:hypothetical protein